MDQERTTEIPSRRADFVAAAPERCCPKCGLVVPDALVCPQDGTSLLEQPGTILANSYEFLKETGRGGMSVIYRAKELKTGKVVAIKMLQAVSVTEESLKRFYQEVKAISSLHHPNIISVHDFGVTESGQPYMVMDFVEGRSLGEVIKEKGALSLEESLHRFIQLCDALGHAHDVGVLHRDLKPRNIMLSSVDGNFEDTRLVDFGIAKLLDQEGEDVGHLTQTGQLFGSPLYMSPEQCRGSRVDARSDIYSMGCVMYETLTGRPPLQGATILDTIMMQMNDVPVSLAGACPQRRFPQVLESIIAKTMAKDPAERFQTMQELEMALMQIRPDLRVTGETGDQANRSKSREKPLRVPLFVYLCFSSFVAAMVVAFLWSKQSNIVHETFFSVDDSTALIAQYRKKLLEYIDRKHVDDALLADCLREDLRMTELNLAGATMVSDSGAEHISVLTSLKSLYLDDTKVHDMTLAHLQNLPLLDTLHLLRTKVGDFGMMHLLKHKSVLRELYVTDTLVGNNGLSSIAKMQALRRLSIGYLKDVTEEGLLQLKDLKLEKLYLTALNLSDTGLAVVDNMTSLQELFLQETKITNQGLAHLKNLKNLQVLNIARTKLSGQALSYLKGLQSLTLLQAGETNIGDDGMVYLQNLPALRTLRLNNTKVTDKALAPISQINTLSQLNLANTGITDAGLNALKNMPQLGVLEIQGTDITDQGLQVLRQYPKLTTLNLSNCRGITSDAVAKLRTDRPKWQITFDPGIW